AGSGADAGRRAQPLRPAGSGDAGTGAAAHPVWRSSPKAYEEKYGLKYFIIFRRKILRKEILSYLLVMFAFFI
ncbi:MAG: hypothetical protein E7C63_08535, partial [Finegoldia magna]